MKELVNGSNSTKKKNEKKECDTMKRSKLLMQNKKKHKGQLLESRK